MGLARANDAPAPRDHAHWNKTTMRRARVLVPYRHERKLKAYEDAADAAGLEPVRRYADECACLGDVAGLLLMGGTDVNPRLYGEEARAETDAPDDARDGLELALVGEALERDVPVLAICRGLQLLNVAHGGTLVQHLTATELHDPEAQDASLAVHDVAIEGGTRLAEIAGRQQWAVNSRHHQAAARVGAGLRVSARAEDGTIEALEREDRRFVVAVQWHPEDQVRRYEEQRRLFEAFAAALG